MYHIIQLLLLFLNIIHMQTLPLDETDFNKDSAAYSEVSDLFPDKIFGKFDEAKKIKKDYEPEDLFPVNIFGMFDEAKNIFTGVVSKMLDKRKVISLDSVEWIKNKLVA